MDVSSVVSSAGFSVSFPDLGVSSSSGRSVALAKVGASEIPLNIKSKQEQGESTAASAASEKELAQAVRQVNAYFKQQGQSLYAAFEKDKLTGIAVVKVVDQKTNQTIRQLPAKEMIAFAQFLRDPHGMGKLLDAMA